MPAPLDQCPQLVRELWRAVRQGPRRALTPAHHQHNLHIVGQTRKRELACEQLFKKSVVSVCMHAGKDRAQTSYKVMPRPYTSPSVVADAMSCASSDPPSVSANISGARHRAPLSSRTPEGHGIKFMAVSMMTGTPSGVTPMRS
jgi:hypothetical protein